MISLGHAKGKCFALFGLGASGVATAKALLAGGAQVSVWDDNEQSRAQAVKEGLNVVDLRDLDWLAIDSFVLSPGVPLNFPEPHWSVQLASANAVEIVGDIELFCRERRLVAPKSQLIAITGTNGKSTTTALIAHILREGGKQVEMGGNIGVPALELQMGNEKIFVLECSSYQIELAPTLDPDVGVLLNITEDHLDRHGSMQHYADVKEKLIKGIRGGGIAAIGIDDPYCEAIAKRAWDYSAGEIYEISVQKDVEYGICLKGTNLIRKCYDEDERYLLNLETCPALRGLHNAQNAAAAFVATRECGVIEPKIIVAMQNFPGLAHRMQRIGHIGKALIVNDSKATNADAAAKALAAYKNIYWIAGGRAKSGGINSLKEFFPMIRHAYLIGEAADDFAKTLGGHVPVTIAKTLDHAVELSARDTASAVEPNPVILFSPACASFDQFKNFEARGTAFCRAAEQQPGFRTLAR
jgi:UDP-N-acetylmuramoylalanine--D-glutamate ligase